MVDHVEVESVVLDSDTASGDEVFVEEDDDPFNDFGDHIWLDE